MIGGKKEMKWIGGQRLALLPYRKTQLQVKGGVKYDEFEPFKRELVNTFENNRRLLESMIMRKKKVFLEKFVKSCYFQSLTKEIRYILDNRVEYARKLRPVKKEVDTVMWKIDFSHKILDEIDINSSFFTREVNQLLPSQLQNKKLARQVFSYGKTIHGDLHGATMSGLNVHGWDQLGRS